MVFGADMTAVVLDDAPLWQEDKESERKGRERQAGHVQDLGSLLVLADAAAIHTKTIRYEKHPTKLANWKANRALTRVRHVEPTQLQLKNSAPLNTGLSMMFEILTIYPGHLKGLHDHTSTLGFGKIQPLQWHSNSMITNHDFL